MKDWQIIPEIVGCNASLRMATMQTVDAVEQGRHLVVEGEPGSGRRLLARSAWYRRSPGAGSLFTLDCRIFNGDGADALLFGERSSVGAHTTIRLGKLNLAMGGGLLLLHAEYLPLKTQGRLAQTLGQYLLYPRGEAIQLLMTCAPSLHAPLSLHPELAALLLRVRIPALRERVEDIRAIAEAFLRNASPFDAILCSQALIDKFCTYNWPGNITELRFVLRRLLLEAHNGLLDVRHLADLMCRDESCFSLLQGGYRAPHIETCLDPITTSPETRSVQ
jgi:sigma-54 dependent transcriptional regulator, acetoin dehydrogenase operon transcriptional activator AcoR